MRMWTVSPRVLCRKHLLGEHVENHMFIASILKGKSLFGYLEKNCLAPYLLFSRHGTLAEEITRRGYIHQSPLTVSEEEVKEVFIRNHSYNDYLTGIDEEASLKSLLDRCPECKANLEIERLV